VGPWLEPKVERTDVQKSLVFGRGKSGSHICIGQVAAATCKLHCQILLFYTAWAKKSEATHSWPQFCQILTDLQTFLFTGRFPGKFAIKNLLKNLTNPHILYVATLPCETLVSENKRFTMNYKVVQLHI